MTLRLISPPSVGAAPLDCGSSTRTRTSLSATSPMLWMVMSPRPERSRAVRISSIGGRSRNFSRTAVPPAKSMP